MNTTEQTQPFQVKWCDKRDFVKWINSQFPSLTKGVNPDFAPRAEEARQAALVVHNRIRTTYKEGDPLYGYYRNDFERLSKPDQTPVEIAEAICDFMTGIEWE